MDGPELPDKTGLDRTKDLRKLLQTDAYRIGDESSTSSKQVRRQDISEADFFKRSDKEVVEVFGKAFKDELRQLKRIGMTVEASHGKTPDGNIGEEKKSPSRLLFDQDYAEVNRSLVGMLALKWLIANEYDAFSLGQPPAIKITKSSFEGLRNLFLHDLRSAGEVYALFVSTIVNDLGKDPEFESDIISRYYEKSRPNHDALVYTAAKNGRLPLIQEFPEGHESRKYLLLGLELGASLIVAQLGQAENIPASLSGLRNLREAPHAFALKYLEIILDIAGAQGHNDARGAKTFIEPLYKSYASIHKILWSFIEEEKSLRATYDQVLIQRGDLLQAAGFFDILEASINEEVLEEVCKRDKQANKDSNGDFIALDKEPLVRFPFRNGTFDITDMDDRSLLRIFCMGRVTSTASAVLHYKAFLHLSEEIRRKLTDGMSVDGVDDGTAILPYYAPALLLNALASHTPKHEADFVMDEVTRQAEASRKVSALEAGMRFLARVYRDTAPIPNAPGKVVECDLSIAAAHVKNDEFKNDVTSLDRLGIDENWYSAAD